MLKHTQINEIFGISESFELPEKLMRLISQPDVLTEIYEEFLQLESDFSFDWFTDYFQEQHSNRENMMQDFTPKAIAQIIAELSGNFQNCADICSGTGGLTIAMWGQCPEAFYYCEELSKRAFPLLLFNLAIRNINAVAVNKDVLTNEVFAVYKISKKERFGKIEKLDKPPELPFFERVVMNPPYSVKHKWDKQQEDNRFRDYSFPPSNFSDFAFVIHGLNILSENGKLSAILPHGVLFRGNSERNIRQKLCENNMLSAVIGLPDNLFMNTGIPVCAIQLEKSLNTLFIDASKDFQKKSKLNILEQKHIKKIICAVKLRSNIEKYSHLADKSELESNEYNLNIPRYVDTFEPPELPDPVQTARNIARLDSEIRKTDKEIYSMMCDLIATDNSNTELIKTLRQTVQIWGEMINGEYAEPALYANGTL